MRLHDQQRFTGNQVLLYLVLIEQFNRAGEGDKWPDSLRFQDPMLSALTGVSINKMKEFRLELQARHLIDFKEPGQGIRTGTQYWLGKKRSSENDEVKPERSSEKSSERLSENDELKGKRSSENDDLFDEDHQKDHQESHQKDCQKLTTSYIYSIPNYPNLQTSKQILFVARRDDASVWQVIILNLSFKKKAVAPKPPKLRQAPPNIPFGDWWDLYGKKRDKAECEVRWNKLTDASREAIMQHTAEYVRVTLQQFRKDPIRYLKKASWTDEVINPDQSERRADSGTGGPRVRNGSRQNNRECGEELDRLAEQYFGS